MLFADAGLQIIVVAAVLFLISLIDGFIMAADVSFDGDDFDRGAGSSL